MPSRIRNFDITDVVGVLLRIPPVFILDQLLNLGLDLDNLLWVNGILFGGTFVLWVLRLLLLIGGCILSTVVLLLNPNELVAVHTYALCIFGVFYSYRINSDAIAVITNKNITVETYASLTIDSEVLLSKVLPVCFFQIILSSMYTKFYFGPSKTTLCRMTLISFTSPLLLCFFPLPCSVLPKACIIFATLPLAVISTVILKLLPSMAINIEIAINYCKDHVLGFGIASFIELEWNRIKLPYVLRIFWILRFAFYAFVYWKDPVTVTRLTVMPDMNEDTIMTEMAFRNGSLKDENWIPPEEDLLMGAGNTLHLLKWLLVTGCDNCIAVLGLTSLVSRICNVVGIAFREILVADAEDRNFGTVSAILFFILALQTGITGLEPEKRYVRLCRNFYLLFTAMLHIIHGMLHPVLMSLSASQNSVLQRHARALLVGLFLIVYPLAQLYYLWSRYTSSSWLLAVSAFSIEVVIKVFISLLIYGLFIADFYKTTFWEELDDYVYYIRAAGSGIEFCFGIFLFFNGAWILVFESGGAIRAAMMCVHAYFNIWCEAKSGWVTFVKRRTAVQKINTLPDATAHELENFKDVCSICYQQMKSAKVTTCKHYFHAVCLRKWLYLQDHCPLCHTVLYRQRGSLAVYDLRRRYRLHLRQVAANRHNALVNHADDEDDHNFDELDVNHLRMLADDNVNEANVDEAAINFNRARNDDAHHVHEIGIINDNDVDEDDDDNEEDAILTSDTDIG